MFYRFQTTTFVPQQEKMEKIHDIIRPEINFYMFSRMTFGGFLVILERTRGKQSTWIKKKTKYSF